MTVRTRTLIACAVAMAAMPLFAHSLRTDFNGDGKSDLLWRHQVTGDVALWEMDGRTILDGSVIFSVPDFNYQIQGFGDFNGDGYDDIFWRNSATLELAIWEMQARSILNGDALEFRPGPEWIVAGFGDFNGDRYDEVLWYNDITTQVAMWEMNGHQLVNGGVFFTVGDPDWRIKAVNDFYGKDGIDDILWFNERTRQVAIWHMDGRTIVEGHVVGEHHYVDEVIAGSGDFNGDGYADVIWRDFRNGDADFWSFNGTEFRNDIAGSGLGENDYRWNLEHIGDFNDDGRDEVVWWNSADTDVAMWEICRWRTTPNDCWDADPHGVIFRVWDPDWRIEPPGAPGTPRPEDALRWRITSELISGGGPAEGCRGFPCQRTGDRCVRPYSATTPLEFHTRLMSTACGSPPTPITKSRRSIRVTSAT